MDVIDCHVHVRREDLDQPGLLRRMQQAGVGSAFLLSLPPAGFETLAPALPWARRLDNVLACCEGQASLRPFLWVDPTETDARDQVAAAVQRGVRGFKIICDHFLPSHADAMATYEAMARAGRPILFHSGVLWDGKDSSRYNRPMEFESLLGISGLTFALAHASWPWCDELVALFGKAAHAAQAGRSSARLFVDLTPGTPACYREGMLRQLFRAGYAVERRVLFGSDCVTDSYQSEEVSALCQTDEAILRTLGVGHADRDALFGANARDFLGES